MGIGGVMRKYILVLLAIVCLGMTGCGSKYMQPADPAIAQSQPDPDKSKIVFFRATSFGGAIQSWVCEEEDGKLEYVAVISAGTKFAHVTTPGKHIYMTGAENSELMEVTMEGGKTYYAYISPRIGWWKARFVFMPVTKEELSSSGFKEDLAWCTWQENGPEVAQWFTGNLPSLNKKYTEALDDFIKNPEDRKILRPEDGSPVPIF